MQHSTLQHNALDHSSTDNFATITASNVEKIGDYATRFWIEYSINGRTDKLDFAIEHKEWKTQALGQKALAALASGCEMVQTNDSSEFVGQTFHPALIAEIETILREGERPRAKRLPKAHVPQAQIAILHQKDDKNAKFVYVISCIDSDEPLCKIGIASSPESRLRQLSTSSPHELRLEMTRWSDDARAVESAAHSRFSGDRRNGEWFSVTASQAISAINSIAEAV